MIKEIDSKSCIKTYLARLDPIIKEIIPKDKDEYDIIYERLEELKKHLDIYEIIEENERFYIVIENNNEIISKIDKLILSDELDIKKEGIIHGQGNPVTKEEIMDLFEMEKSMCKILYETLDNNKGKSTGFFCKININFPIKYALFTNNHVLNENNLEIGRKIRFECLELTKYYFSSGYSITKKQIEITENRKIFTNQKLDYTCIELFESDGIVNYFEIDPNIFKNNNNIIFENNDIFVLQYPNGNDLSFSYGKILSLENNEIKHSASTESGSSGSPIIRRCKDNDIIGLHRGGIKKNKKEYRFNLATPFDSILDDIKEQLNEIICIFIPDKNNKEINILHDYNEDVNEWDNENMKKEYLEAKIINKKLFEENIDIYVNSKKINFDYKINESREAKVKFKFKKLLTKTSYMFYKCSSLKSIDLSAFNTSNVNNMSNMFCNCSSLKYIDLFSFNTTNVSDMSFMFCNCSSLKSIDLSSFNTSKVNNMSFMFNWCSTLKKIDLSSFDTTNVNNMSFMFYKCSSLKSIDFSSFNTSNVNDMSYMLDNCSSLKKENIIINKKDEKLLKKINEDIK